MGTLTISMAIFNSFLYVYQRVSMAITVAPDPKDFGTERNGKCRPWEEVRDAGLGTVDFDTQNTQMF